MSWTAVRIEQTASMYGQPVYGQPVMQYQPLPGMVTTQVYLQPPQFYNRVYYQWYGPYQDPRMPFQVSFPFILVR